MIKNIFFVCWIFLFVSCNEFSASPADEAITGKERKLPEGIQYNYDCLKADSGKISDVWSKADNIISKVATFNI